MDIVSSCQRKADTAYDTDLINIDWNIYLIRELLKANPVETIYFTSTWVRDQFNRHISQESMEFKSFVLPSPSRNGLRSIKRATYLDLNAEDGESATNFRRRCYKYILNK